jgi:hypothetical protein
LSRSFLSDRSLAEQQTSDDVLYEGSFASILGESSIGVPTPGAGEEFVDRDKSRPFKKRRIVKEEDLLDAAKLAAEKAWQLWTTDVKKILKMPQIKMFCGDMQITHRDKLDSFTYNAIANKFDVVHDWGFKDIMDNFIEEKRIVEMADNYYGISGLFGTKTDSTDFMAVSDSADVLIRLLEHNAPCPAEAKDFFIDWVKWFDRQRGKKNTQLMVGEKDSCKTWFAKAWCKLAVYVGQLSNPTRGESAPFSGAADGRILFWDEADIGMEASFADVCKMLLGGQEVSVNMKYKNRQIIQPAPVLMCSNNNPCRMSDTHIIEPLHARWNWMNWSSTEAIRSLIYKECNPIALFEVYKWANGDLIIQDPNLVDEPTNLSFLHHQLDKLEDEAREDILNQLNDLQTENILQ